MQAKRSSGLGGLWDGTPASATMEGLVHLAHQHRQRQQQPRMVGATKSEAAPICMAKA